MSIIPTDLTDLAFYDVEPAVAIAFEESLRTHVAYVQEAGKTLGLPKAQLARHDESKWSQAEFPAYARHFMGGGDPVNFPAAWLHHIHENPHHWQHWMFPDGWILPGSPMENGILEMPEEYALEMIADWMGASKTYTGSWDMAAWLKTNMPRISVHSKTALYLRQVLSSLGYWDIISTVHFATEKGD